MRLLKTLSHTSERPGYEARKNAKKAIEGNADTIRRQSIRQNLPRTASVAGGRDEKGATARPTTAKTLPRIVGVTGGGKTKEDELKENTGAKTRETKVKTLPQATIVAGRSETKGENQHKMKRWHNPQSHARGRYLADNTYQKRKQNNMHHKEKTKQAVLCHYVSSQITLAAPRLGAEEGVGRTTKNKNTKNPQSRVSV